MLFTKGFFSLFLIFLLSFFAVKPLFHPDFFPMHDDTQVSRVYEMAQAISFGQFPVRLVSNLGYGYGYPLFNFYAPLPYYIGAIFNLVGFNVITATKIMFGIGILLSCVTMFFLVKELWDEYAGIISALLYMYAPYHAVNIYVRGAVGEFYAMGFLPLVLLGVITIVKSKSIKQGVLIGSAGFAGVLLSHNILGMITAYFLVAGLIIYFLYLLIRKKRLLVICYLLSFILLGLGLSAFFVIPALAEKGYTNVGSLTTGGSNFRQHFVYLDQLWNSSWGFAGSAPGRADGMSFKIGKLHIYLGLLSVMAAFYLYKKKKMNKFLISIICSLLSVLIVSIFFMLSQSQFFWQILPGFPFIQYPWRFLALTILSLSVLPFSLFMLIKKRYHLIAFIGVVILTIWLNSKYFEPREYTSAVADDYISKANLRYKISKISDEYLPKSFVIPQNYSEVSQQGITSTKDLLVTDTVENPTQKKYLLFALQDTDVLTQIAYFPGWQAKLDGKKVEIKEFQGRIRVVIHKGSHDLIFEFKDTLSRSLSNAISIFCLFLLVYVLLFWKGNYHGKKIFSRNSRADL